MSKDKLLSRVKSINTRSKSMGKEYLLLLCECIERMHGVGDETNKDWTPMAFLLGKSQDKDARMLRKIAGKILDGWSLVKDDKQDSGLRFGKKNDATYDKDLVQRIRALADQGKVLHSKAIAELLGGEKESKPKDWKVWAERQAKAHPNDLRAMIAALQAQLPTVMNKAA